MLFIDAGNTVQKCSCNLDGGELPGAQLCGKLDSR